MTYFELDVTLHGEPIEGAQVNQAIWNNFEDFNNWFDGQTQQNEAELNFGFYNFDEYEIEAPGDVNFQDINGDPLEYNQGYLDQELVGAGSFVTFRGFTNLLDEDSKTMECATSIGLSFSVQVEAEDEEDAASIFERECRNYFYLSSLGDPIRIEAISILGHSNNDSSNDLSDIACKNCGFTVIDASLPCTECGV